MWNAGKQGEKILDQVPHKSFSVNETAKLFDDMPEFTGTTREKLLAAIQDNDLYKIVNELYRSTATVGD